MKTQLRLNSVVPHGVGSGPDSIVIDVIYTYLLKEYGQDKYRYIGVNQIGNDLNEFVMKEPGNHIHCNIRYPVYENLESRSIDEQNRIRLDVVHSALLRIADYDKKLNIEKLEALRKKILDNNFSFEFVCRIYPNKKDKLLFAKVIVNPQMNVFDYYAIIEHNGNQKCKRLIYSGKPVSIYSYADFFGIGKWKGLNDFRLIGKNGEVETRILIDTCNVEIVNLTAYPQPPSYTLMKANITDEEQENARKDYEHSISPAIAAVIRQSLGDASN